MNTQYFCSINSVEIICNQPTETSVTKIKKQNATALANLITFVGELLAVQCLQ